MDDGKTHFPRCIECLCFAAFIGLFIGGIQHAAGQSAVDYFPEMPCASAPTNNNILWRNIGPFNSEGGSASNMNCYGKGVPNCQKQGRIEAISVHPKNPNDLLIGSHTGGIWRSTNGGKNWANTTDAQGFSVCGYHDLARHPANPNIVYAASRNNRGGFTYYEDDTYGIGLIVSEDGGSTWRRTVLTNEPSYLEGYMTKIAIDPSSTLDSTVLYVAAQRRVLRYVGNALVDKGTPNAVFSDWSWFGWEVACGQKKFMPAWFHGTSRVTDMAISKQGTLWICSHSGVFRLSPALLASSEVTIGNGSTGFPMEISHQEAVVELASPIVGAIASDSILFAPTPLNADEHARIIRNPLLVFAGVEINQNDDVVLALSVRYFPKGYNCAKTPPYSKRYFLHSTDKGEHWRVFKSNLPAGLFLHFTINSFDTNIIYAEGDRRCAHKSIDGGATFVPMNNTPNHADIRTWVLYQSKPGALEGSQDVLYIGTDGGISKTTNGYDWQDITGQGIANTQYYWLGIYEKDPELIIGGAQDGNINFYHKGSWRETEPGGDNLDVAICSPNDIFQASQAQLFHCKEGGEPCRETSINQNNLTGTNPLPSTPLAWPPQPLYINPNNNTELFCASNHLLLLDVAAKNAGLSKFWTIIYDTTTHKPQQISAIGMSKSDNKSVFYTVYGTNTDAGVYQAKRVGNNWKIRDISGNLRLPNGNLPSNIKDITVSPTNANEIWICFTGFVAEHKVFRTLNGGKKWENMSGCLPNLPVTSIAYQPNSPQRLFVGTDTGVFFRDNANTNWACYGKDGPRCAVTDIEINEPAHKLVCSTYGRGIWEVYLPK